MNDIELDELLEKWTVPDAPHSLRARVRAGFTAGTETREKPAFNPWRRRGLWVGAFAGLAVVLLMVTQAFPQKLPAVRPPYIVDSDFITYAVDGSPTVALYTTSYANNGQEVVLSKSIPGDPLKTALWQVVDSVGSAWQKLTVPFQVSPELLEKVREVRKNSLAFTIGREGYLFHKSADPAAGCSDRALSGRETILNYPTAATHFPAAYQRRGTVWLAPDLGCFALRITIEEPQPDGSFRLIGRRQALRVHLSP